MTKNSNTSNKKFPKKKENKNEKKMINKKYGKKRNIKSDSDNDSNSDTGSDYNSHDENMMDHHEYRKFINTLFPSKHLKEKIKAGEKLKNMSNDESETEYTECSVSYEESVKKGSTKKQEKQEKQEKKKNNKYDDDDDDDNSSDSTYENNNKNKETTMIFRIGLDDDDNINWEDYDSEYSESYSTENEDEDVSSASDSDNSDEKSYDNEEHDHDICVINKNKNKKSKICKSVCKKDYKDLDNMKDLFNKELNDSNEEEVLKNLREMYEKNKNSMILKECISVCEEKIRKRKRKQEKKIRKQSDKNTRIFRRIMKDKNVMNDFTFFQTLTIDEQKKIIKELREINKLIRVETPYRISLLESNIPTLFKGAAIKKINSLKCMEPGSGEYHKIKNWVDTFMRIPFNNYNTLPINIDDGIDKCHEFMENAQKTLDDAVYGLNDAKIQIMQMLGQLITNPKSIGTAIAIHGPMGTGKTTLVKEGISKILNRPFAFIALGGATDSSFLEGHSYTYEGSTWGKIVQILMDSKCMNPIIYFDELDKISDTPKGEEITGILTHLTDTSQNNEFHDKYFAEISFDLSKCLFIFSYNDESKVNPILRDRMYRIQTKGYDKKQKTAISINYLLPKLREQVKFSIEDIKINDEALHYIIDNHCNKEDGVRNLKRCLEIIYTKLNLYRLMKPGTNLFEQEMCLKVEFPFLVTKDVVDKLIKREDNFVRRSLEAMYV